MEKHVEAILYPVMGGGDGVKEFTPIRHPVPQSRKFTPTLKKKQDNKIKLELALRDMQKLKRINNSRMRNKEESISLDTPGKLMKKNDFKDSRTNKELEIYATPRAVISNKYVINKAGRAIYKYLLLNSWRKSRTRSKNLSELLEKTDNAVKQLNMQIDVLQNLRKAESFRREDITNRYNDIQRQLSNVLTDNVNLKKEIELLNNDRCAIKNKFNDANSQLKDLRDNCHEKEKSLTVMLEKYQREKQRSKTYMAERNHSIDRNMKLDNTVNNLNENIQNFKANIENLQNSKFLLSTQLEKSEKKCEEYAERLHSQMLVIKSFESKISLFEKEKALMGQELKALEMNLEMAQNDYTTLKGRNESIQQEVFDLSQILENDKNSMMRKGVSSAYIALKYLASLMLSALSSNFTG